MDKCAAKKLFVVMYLGVFAAGMGLITNGVIDVVAPGPRGATGDGAAGSGAIGVPPVGVPPSGAAPPSLLAAPSALAPPSAVPSGGSVLSEARLSSALAAGVLAFALTARGFGAPPWGRRRRWLPR